MNAPLDDPLPSDALAPEPGWAPLGPWPFPHGKPGRFVVGDDGGTRYRLRYYRDAADPERLHGKVWFGPGCEGPPGHAHGGSMAALLDEASGMCCWVTGTKVVAASLHTHFLRMLPLRRVVRVEAHIHFRSERRLHVRARLFDERTEFASAEGVFAVLPGHVAESLQQAMAERDG